VRVSPAAQPATPLGRCSPRAPRVGSLRAVPSGPKARRDNIFRCRLHDADGDDLGESVYSVPIKPDDVIHVNSGQKYRVLDVVPLEENDDSPLAGLLMVEAAELGLMLVRDGEADPVQPDPADLRVRDKVAVSPHRDGRWPDLRLHLEVVILGGAMTLRQRDDGAALDRHAARHSGASDTM
jgi:hypothetical protein